MRRNMFLASLFAITVLVSSHAKADIVSTNFQTQAVTAAPVNILLNGSFEGPVANPGNNVGTVPAGWTTDAGTGQGFNLVRSVGNGALGSDQFVDLLATGYVTQSFTISEESIVDFGAYFSPRDGATAGGFAAIYDATDATQLAAAPTTSATGSNTPFDLSAGTITLAAGTYNFRATLDNPANVDEAFVTATATTTAVPEPSSLAVLALCGLSVIGRRRR